MYLQYLLGVIIRKNEFKCQSKRRWRWIDYSDKPAIKSPGICEANISAFKASIICYGSYVQPLV